ncbi:ProQ/FinO family protein [Sphaerotilus sp.]|uniref:ProQ/FinO family protein n=1 Tax=Sphaerotilus sp. TaxID=2093942 RepID=UPI00286E2AFF|nr:ProQ/FinO family protein [Sphaerotilus sp.]
MSTSDTPIIPEEAAQPVAESIAEPVAETVADSAAVEPVAETVADTAVVEAPAAAAPKVPEMTPSECARQLKDRFPALFAGTAAKPLKLRIQADIKERAPGVFTKAVMSAFLRRHTGTTAYLIALTKAEHRFDLDGQPAGEITDEHRQVAQEELDRRRAVHQDRRAKDAETERANRDKARAEERAAQTQQREEQELQEQKRRNRAQLLRDFEKTTLTRGNFCVLKGLPEADLDRVLEIARKEMAEWVASRPATPPIEHLDDRRPRRPDGDRPARRDTRGPIGASGSPRRDRAPR